MSREVSMSIQTEPDQTNRPLGPGDPEFDALLDEHNYFQTIRQELCNQPALRSKYVAIFHHQIIDQDTDMFALSHRMDKKHPKEVVLLAKVELTDPIYELPSPELR